MKILRLAVMVIVFFSCQSDQKKETSAKENFQFVSGDLIFQDLDCGALCDAIESVTPGLNGQKFSHMGMFMVVNNKPFVVEAITPKVKLTRLDSFLNRSTTKNGTPKISVGRVKMEHKRILDKALRSVEKYVNQPYDDTFLINNGAYYCSELIYELFMDPHDSTSLFELAPMTFKNANSDSFNTAWVDYYAQLKTQIPEGLPGINPGLIANSDNLEVIHQPVNQ